MAADVDVLVIGGGVVGLAIARALLMAGREVLLIERNQRLGAETSSRNSEVIHAGLYYPTGSLRATMCVKGKQMLRDFAAENGVAVREYGKLLVATEEDELPRLQKIAETAARNGVTDLQPLSGAQARALEPELSCVAAYLSPRTAVIDSHGLLVALEGHVLNLGGYVSLNTTAQSISLRSDGDFEIETVSMGEVATISARSLVLAAGLGGSSLAKTIRGFNAYQPPETFPARGHYYSLTGQAPFQHLVYPMPQGAWLGLHYTRDSGGRAKFGPDIEWIENISYDFDHKNGERLRVFEREIRRYWPGLPDGALQPDYTGVRPKIYREGEAAADFAIHGPSSHGVQRLVALFGIESPGLTSSLAIADVVANNLQND